ncbi:uncharacterized protein L3040_006819 [Drepanopeziza brunnea f. sp. 'multigermtubi']|uniref:uncharacterized protein n=1 Tax=Drepanopeziza brunnea f. sp. 'multigermtubi' TaxID=698441 RepID=UPI00239AB0D1|nr:hypothetical protein L3040_006819 [Drepanopeziza brunnea f. sp. 'multigermtubi']
MECFCWAGLRIAATEAYTFKGRLYSSHDRFHSSLEYLVTEDFIFIENNNDENKGRIPWVTFRHGCLELERPTRRTADFLSWISEVLT